MADPVRVQCPYCGAALKLKSRAPLGKKVPCPKCETPFVAKEKPSAARKKTRQRQPVEEADEFGDFEEYGPEDDYTGDDFGDAGFDDRMAPPRKKTGGGKQTKKRKGKKKGMPKGLKIGLGVGGGLLGATLLGLLIWLMVGLFSTDLDMAWLPEDANDISVTRYASMWKSQAVQEELEAGRLKRRDVEKMKNEWGIAPEDILSVTEGRVSGRRLRVVRTNIDMDEGKILAHARQHEEADHNGTRYYRIGSNALFFPDPRTAVCGPEEMVKEAIDRGPDAEPREDVEFVDAGYDIVEVSVHSGSTSGKTTIPFGMYSVDSRREVTATAFGTTYSSDLRMSFQAQYTSADAAAESAEKGRETIEQKVEEWETSLREETRENLKKMNRLRRSGSLSDEEIERILDAREAALRSVSISHSGKVVTMTFRYQPPKLDVQDDPTARILGGQSVLKIKSLIARPGRLFGIGGLF